MLVVTLFTPNETVPLCLSSLKAFCFVVVLTISLLYVGRNGKDVFGCVVSQHIIL
jgi:hypothetical protein